MSKRIKWLIAVLLAISAVSVAAVVFMAAHRPGGDEEDEEEETVQAPVHVLVQNGETVIRLSAQTQARQGIRVQTLPATAMRAELRGTAVLLPAADLAALRNSYVAAHAQWQRDQVNAKVARIQQKRVTSLYAQNQNMSLQAMQDAQAASRTAQAQLQADQQETELQLDSARQRWGPAVAGWVANDAPPLQALLRQRAFLAQVILPPGEIGRAPARLSLSLPGNQLATARLIGALPQVSPQIQGISFLYLAPSRPGLAAGMNLPVLVPVGPRRRGTVVPDSAIVWWQGKAWAYQETAENTFTRREVSTQNPVPEGYFVFGTQFSPSARLVTAGAQELFSEEFRSQIQQED
jgi:hypothetical protein